MVEYLVILQYALIHKYDVTYNMTHMNMSNPFIPCADLLPNQVVTDLTIDPNGTLTTDPLHT